MAIGRNRLWVMLSIALLVLGILLAVVSCGGQTTATTTTTLAVTTTAVAVQTSMSTVASTTSTTTQPTTTTSTVPTTTTTVARSWEDLISKDKTIEDVKYFNDSKPDRHFIKEPINVPTNLQNAFKAKFPGEKILYVGPDNRGLELNDAVVTIGAVAGDNATMQTYGGYMLKLAEPMQIRDFFFGIKFKDIILIPNSQDFIAHGIDPLNNNMDIWLHIVVNNPKYHGTQITCYDIGDPFSFDYGFDPSSKLMQDEKRLVRNIEREELLQFFIPGDTMQATIFNHEGFVPIYDSYGIPVVRLLADFRYAGADKIEALFK